MKYNIEKLDSHVVIWDDEEGIGLRFQEGDSMQRYTSEVIIKNPELLSTEDGYIRVNDVSEELRKYAETIYPKEFAPIKEGMNRVEDYPIFKENTDEIIRYLNKEDVSESLLDEIAHNNVVRIQQNKDGSLSYQIRETQHSYFSVQPGMGIKKGFLGYFTPKAEDVAYYNNNELLAAQYATSSAFGVK